jgi:hypothetical protein
MNDPAGVASHAGALLPTMPSQAPVEVLPRWEPAPKQLSMMESVSASAFLVFYLVAYLAAGYVGVTFMEWAWMRIFG